MGGCANLGEVLGAIALHVDSRSSVFRSEDVRGRVPGQDGAVPVYHLPPAEV